MAVNPKDRNMTTKNIPKALEAARRTGGRLAKSTVLLIISEPSPRTPTSMNIPQINRLLMIALFNLSLIENYPAYSYSWAMGSSSQVKKNINAQLVVHTTLIAQSDWREKYTSQGSRITLLKHTSHVKNTDIFTKSPTDLSEQLQIRQATQRKDRTICKMTIQCIGLLLFE